MNSLSNGPGSEFIVRSAETGKVCTNAIVYLPMHDKLAVAPVELYCNSLEPSPYKTELQQFVNMVKKHWRDVEDV